MFFFDTLVIDKAANTVGSIPSFGPRFPGLHALCPSQWIGLEVANLEKIVPPIFFINANKYGRAFVGKWVVIIFIAYLFIGYVLYGSKISEISGRF